MEKHRALETKSLVIVYGGLSLLCLIWEYFSRDNMLWSWLESKSPEPHYIIFSIFFVALYIAFATGLPKMFPWARELEKVFRQVLTPLSYFQIFYLAILSGFIEEWFFRGILLNQFGLVLSSIIFGLAHLIPVPKLWLWSLWTFAIGALLGAIYRGSDSLVLVALIHTIINGVLLMFLNRTAQKAPALPSN
jgi:membrane protease YdiL (CAAX protease family)